MQSTIFCAPTTKPDVSPVRVGCLTETQRSTRRTPPTRTAAAARRSLAPRVLLTVDERRCDPTSRPRAVLTEETDGPARSLAVQQISSRESRDKAAPRE